MRSTMKIKLIAAAFLALALVSPAAAQQIVEARELKLEIKEAENRLGERLDKLADRVEELESARRWWTLLAVEGLGLLGLNLIVVLIAYYKACRFAKKEADRRLREIISGRSQVMSDLIDQHDLETRLRESAQILIVSDSRRLQGFLEDAKFEKVRTISRDEAMKTEIDRSATVVIDREGGCSEENGKELVAKNRLEYLLVYVDGRSDIETRYVNRANSLVTLYARLMELLRLRYLTEHDILPPLPRGAAG